MLHQNEVYGVARSAISSTLNSSLKMINSSRFPSVYLSPYLVRALPNSTTPGTQRNLIGEIPVFDACINVILMLYR